MMATVTPGTLRRKVSGHDGDDNPLGAIKATAGHDGNGDPQVLRRTSISQEDNPAMMATVSAQTRS